MLATRRRERKFTVPWSADYAKMPTQRHHTPCSRKPRYPWMFCHNTVQVNNSCQAARVAQFCTGAQPPEARYILLVGGLNRAAPSQLSEQCPAVAPAAFSEAMTTQCYKRTKFFRPPVAALVLSVLQLGATLTGRQQTHKSGAR